MYNSSYNLIHLSNIIPTPLNNNPTQHNNPTPKKYKSKVNK